MYVASNQNQTREFGEMLLIVVLKLGLVLYGHQSMWAYIDEFSYDNHLQWSIDIII